MPLPIRVRGHTRRLVPWRDRTPVPHVQTSRDRPSLELPAGALRGGSLPGQALEKPASGQKERPEWKPPRPSRGCVSPGSREQLQAECLPDLVLLFA